MLGGGYRMIARGSGITVSAVGRGFVTLDGDPRFAGDDAGVYSFEGVDCSAEPLSCAALPTEPTRFPLERRRRRRVRSGASRREHSRRPILVVEDETSIASFVAAYLGTRATA